MKWLGKLFNRKKKLESSSELKLCIIDDTTDDMWTTLGIIDERREEIVEFCKEAYKIADKKHQSYQYIIEKCKHINEVVVATIVFERYCELNDRGSIIQMFKKHFDNEDY